MANFRRSKTKKLAFFAVLVFVVVFMSIGYSLINVQLNLTATANLYASKDFLWYKIINDFRPQNLQQVSYENNKYAYVGNNVDNYVQFEGTLWRIISIESDNTIKLMNTTPVVYSFDNTENRTSSSTYCIDLENGCNSWSQQTNLVNGDINGSVENNSSLLNALNPTVYNSFSSDGQNKLVLHDFHVGAVQDQSTLQSIIAQEQAIIWNGYVGLPNLSDYMFSQSGNMNSTITGTYNSYMYEYSSFGYQLTLNPLYNDSSKIWAITPNQSHNTIYAKESSIEEDQVNKNVNTFIVIYLNSNVKYASGDGSQQNPYILQ